MANKKKEIYKPGPMTEGKRNIIVSSAQVSQSAQRGIRGLYAAPKRKLQPSEK